MNMNDPKVKEALDKSIQELMVMPTEEFKRHMDEATKNLVDLSTYQDDNFYGTFSAEFLRET
jgi:hypothetical protein